MNHAKKVDIFVHRCFDMYGLNFKHYFSEFFDEEYDEDGIPYGGHLEELPLAIGENIDMDLLAQAAHVLGVHPEALMQMDRAAVEYWYDKYPYFSIRREFELARRHSLKYASSPEEILVDAIFNENYKPENHFRYKDDIKMRLIELLKSYDRVMPGCYHEDAEITKLTIRTNSFTHFEQIEELAHAYLSLVYRARELFYRLWDAELPEDEILEYNFLVSVLGMRDRGYAPSEPIYYETARKFVPVYKQEGYHNYSSYIMYRNADFPAFWTCKELYDHPELIEELIQEFPDMKAKIGEMAVEAKNFYCSFVWSDEPEPPIEDSLDEYVTGVLKALGDDDVTPWYNRVYVPKTEEELHGDETYIAICEKLSAPASQGGLKLPSSELDSDRLTTTKRIMARVEGGR